MSINAVQEKTICSIAQEHIETPSGVKQLIIKPLSKTLDWCKFFKYHFTPPLKEMRELLGRTKQIFTFAAYHRKVQKLFKSFEALNESLKGNSLWNVGHKISYTLYKTSSVLGPVAEGVEIAHASGYLSLSLNQLKILTAIGFFGGLSLSLISCFGIGKEIKILAASNVGEPKFNLSMIRLMRKICSLAMGIFGMMIMIISAHVITPGLFLGVSTASLITSIASYFYGKIHEDQIERLST